MLVLSWRDVRVVGRGDRIADLVLLPSEPHIHLIRN
jgi:hypothetical protein